MKLCLIGHDYKYAVEQIMLMLFPGQRPEYFTLPDEIAFQKYAEMTACVTLTHGRVYTQAATVIINADGVLSRGITRVKRDKLRGKLVTDRLLQRVIKQSFFKASRPFLKTVPVWGSLTGIRPAKLFTAMLESGVSETAAAKIFEREYYVSQERTELCADVARACLDVKRTLSPRDIALYVGIPFCPTRCAYCSFVSNSTEKSLGLVTPFLKALYEELEVVSKLSNKLGLRIASVYIGGGTPTTLSALELTELMAQIGKSFNLSSLREYTVEAGRPDTITEEKLAAIKDAGATRISVNPQSMSSAVLSAIGRLHTPEDVYEAAGLVRNCGGLDLNMDVIAGLPGDTVTGFQKTLEAVLRLNPENVTVHTLFLKKGSRIMLENTEIPDGAQVSQMLDYAGSRLRGRGYSPYYLYRQKYTSGGFENVGWSFTGYEGFYNICMMEETCTVLALGGGGVTKLVSPSGRLERVFNVKYPKEYIERPEKAEEKVRQIEEFFAAEERNGI